MVLLRTVDKQLKCDTPAWNVVEKFRRVFFNAAPPPEFCLRRKKKTNFEFKGETGLKWKMKASSIPVQERQSSNVNAVLFFKGQWCWLSAFKCQYNTDSEAEIKLKSYIVVFYKERCHWGSWEGRENWESVF